MVVSEFFVNSFVKEHFCDLLHTVLSFNCVELVILLAVWTFYFKLIPLLLLDKQVHEQHNVLFVPTFNFIVHLSRCQVQPWLVCQNQIPAWSFAEHSFRWGFNNDVEDSINFFHPVFFCMFACFWLLLLAH